jgi:threonine aldolase
MREAMFRAEVGDDVFGDDPTVLELEEEAASLLGKEAALFVASGTMGNQLAVMTHTTHGDEVLVGRPCHIAQHEAGAAALLSGVTLVPLDAPTGRIRPDAVREAVRTPDLHHPDTRLLCLECAHSSGAVQPHSELAAAADAARGAGLAVHLDGARIFNAAHALSCDPREIAACGDTVMFCLSKGLGAPVGSLLAGSRDFVSRARRGRKRLGGGMRQVGILAAAGLYALANHVERLVEDHRRADRLAEAMSRVPGVRVLGEQRAINMVWLEGSWNASADEMVQVLAERGVLVLGPEGGRLRLVTHLDVDDQGLEVAIRELTAVLRTLGSPGDSSGGVV